MKILILGLGSIGSIYGCVFQKAGHDVSHFVREEAKKQLPSSLSFDLLDGRQASSLPKSLRYQVHLAQPGESFDCIVVSVPESQLQDAIKTLEENNLTGPVLLFGSIWDDRNALEKMLHGRPYAIGYPRAGGTRLKQYLDGVLFDHVMLESETQTQFPDYAALLSLFSDAGIAVQSPHDMLEWIWICMAIRSAFVISVVKYMRELIDTQRAISKMIRSSKALGEVVMTARETLKIVQSRGVNLKHYKDDLGVYQSPSWIAGAILLKTYDTNPLMRRSVQCQGDLNDSISICKQLYLCGQQNHIKARLFNHKYETFQEKWNLL